MPRIDPLSLLKCLSVLLGPNGGIKSKEEVIRLANLMTKFSKKLVSKCIYIQILKSTQPELLNQFMSAGGWNLVHMWLTDGILAKNWALIQELLELLLLCPVDIERLKTNNCPKLIKGLSKEGSHQGVRLLASRLVEQWLKMVKGEVPNTIPAQEVLTSSVTSQSLSNHANGTQLSSQNNNNEISTDEKTNEFSTNLSTNHQESGESKKNSELLHLQTVDKAQTLSSNLSQPSVYKITIRDGKEVLTQVQVDPKIVNDLNDASTNEVIEEAVFDNVLPMEDEKIITKGSNEKIDDKSKISSEAPQFKYKSSDINEVDSGKLKSKDHQNEKDETSVETKNISDKENRDKKEEKSHSGNNLEKKSSSSKKSSSKSSSSSSKHSSSKHSSSSHRSSSKENSKSKSSKSKEKDKHSSDSSKHSSSKSSKSDREKEKVKKDQAEKDKATLEKVQSQILGVKMGKIPKKKTEESESLKKSSSESKDDSKDSKEKTDSKKPIVPEKKNISISIENRKTSQDSSRPKTVKTFNSKFRSTGLEEEVKPQRSSKKPLSSSTDKKVLPSKLSLKRPSPAKDSSPIAEKKAKLALDITSHEEKKGGIKLIAPKPKPMVLQESDMFMDALTASTEEKKVRKRKRRTSISKDDSKKTENSNENNGITNSPPSSPISPKINRDSEDKQTAAVKPNFKFYQDTLETDEDKLDKSKIKTIDKNNDVKGEETKKPSKEDTRDEDDNEGSRTPTPIEDFDDAKREESPDPAAAVTEALLKESENGSFEPRAVGVLKSVLVSQKRTGPKKSLKWKTDLESIRYFELDETERVNVTKTFTDAKLMEKQNEREAFQMARKLHSEDLMEEKTRWKPLIPVDLLPALAEPGKDSREKDIQYAREKGILQAIYFNRSLIPESPSEPDEERHLLISDPKIIPLDDLTGNKESEKDFTMLAWPEPKSTTTTLAQNSYYSTFRPNQTPIPPLVGSQTPMTQIPQQIINPIQQITNEVTAVAPISSNGGGGGWRTGDGKIIVPDSNVNIPNSYTSNIDMQNSMMPGVYNQDGFIINPDEMNFNYQGPPGMFVGPPPGVPPPGGPFPGPRGPMHPNRGRGGPHGPGWFRGAPPRGMPWRGGWRGNNKQPPICRQFTKNGFCRVGDKCQYLHPGVNCPPY